MVASTAARSARSRLCSTRPGRTRCAAGGDDLGGHQRAPRERPALLEAAEVAGQRGGQHDEQRPAQTVRAEDRADAAVRRHLVDARDKAVHDRRGRAHEHHEVHRGVRQAEPEDRRRHPRDRRQHLQARDQRAERAAKELTSASSSPTGVPMATHQETEDAPLSEVSTAACSRPVPQRRAERSARRPGSAPVGARPMTMYSCQATSSARGEHRRQDPRRNGASGRSAGFVCSESRPEARCAGRWSGAGRARAVRARVSMIVV